MKTRCSLLLLTLMTVAADPCASGPLPGQRPGPYTFVVATGPQRGKLHCYVCETEDRPAVIVFARSPNDELGKLAVQIDKALAAHKAADLRGWVTFLLDDPAASDAKVVQWGRKHGLRELPLGTFTDTEGPPVYRLNREAEVTILLSVKQKVVANFAFRAGELKEDKVVEVMKTLPRIVEKK